MKTQISLLFVLSSLTLFLTSCGAKKTTATLKVSSSFALSNGGFQGGLVVVGKSSDGKIFSKPIAYSAGSQSILEMGLPNGTWTFSAVGWDGLEASTVAPLQGKTYCGTSPEMLLNGSSTDINLNLTEADCKLDLFGSSQFRETAASPAIKKFSYAVCGSLYADNNGTSVNAGPVDISQWCGPTSALSQDLSQHDMKAMKISILNFGIDGQVEASPLSFCLPGTAVLTSKRIPFGLAPIQMKLYKTTTCDESDPQSHLSTFDFKLGLEGTYSSFDHRLGIESVTQTATLFLPGGKLQRGFSSFLNLLPNLGCTGNNCLVPPASLGSDRLVRSGQEFVLLENTPASFTCSSLAPVSITGVTASTFDVTKDCWKKDDKIMVRIGLSGGVEGIITFTNPAAVTQTLNFIVADQTFDVFQETFDLLGYPRLSTINSSTKLSFRSMYEDDRQNFGEISRIREMFLPDGPMGVLGQMNCVAGENKEKIVSFLDKEGYQTYRVKTGDLPAGVTPPKYICQSTDARGLSCDTTLTKSIVISKLNGSVFENQEVMFFNCSQLAGTIESLRKENGDIEKTLHYWNTSDPMKPRLESYESHLELKSNGSFDHQHLSYKRIEQIGSNIKTDHISLNIHPEETNPSLYFSHLMRTQLSMDSSTINMTRKGLTLPLATSINEIMPAWLKKSLDDQGPNSGVFIKESSNGQYMVKVSFPFDGSNYTPHIVMINRNNPAANDIVATAPVGPFSSHPQEVNISINNNGKAVVGYNAMNGNNRSYVHIFNGTDWLLRDLADSYLDITPVVHIFDNDFVIVGCSKYNSGYPGLSIYKFLDTTAYTTPTAIPLAAGADISRFNFTLGPDNTLFILTLVNTGGAHLFFEDSNFATSVEPVSITNIGTTFTGIQPITDIESITSGTNVKYYLRYYSTPSNWAKPLSFNKSGATVSLEANVSAIQVPSISFPGSSSVCISRSPSSFNTEQTNCQVLPGTYASPAKGSFKNNFESLRPSNFDGLFTSEANFLSL